MLNNLMTGLALMASAESFIAIFIGLLAGIIIGAIPGLTADIAIILCLPITYSMEPIPAMLLLLGLYCGGTYGGSITAILINTSSAATVLDGYPLTQQGKPAEGSDDGAVCLVFRWPVQCAGIAVCCTEHCTFHTDVWPSGVFLHRSVWLVYYCKHLERQYHQGSARRPDRHFHCTAGTGFGQRYTSVYLCVRRLGAGIPLIVTLGRSVRNCRIAQPLGL